MKFVTVRDFRNSTKDIFERVNNKEEVIITNNGKPAAILLRVTDTDFDEVIASIRQAKAIRAVRRMRQNAEERGFMSLEDINAEIKAYREEKRASMKDNIE